jgi:Leucine-rich repeat (LRR) protein/uncharacterized protein YpmS
MTAVPGRAFPQKSRTRWCPYLTRTSVILLLVWLQLPQHAMALASCFNAPSGLIGWWPGDGNANTIFGTNNGSLQGGATATAPGMVNTAFSFDGTNSFVQIPDSPLLHPTNLTIEAWVLFTGLDSQASGNSPAGDQYIVFKQNTRSGDFEGFDLSKTRRNGSDVFRFLVTSATDITAPIFSATTISTGVWYHVAGVRGTNFTQLYVNGQLERQTNVTFAQDYGTLPLFFGTSGQSFWDHKLKGTLDEVSLYNRALSSNEIASIFAAGAAGKCKAVNITSQPQSQSLPPGTSAAFTVAASGLAPLAYQWRFNSTNLSAATNTSLTLTNIQSANSGDYTVVISNVLGSVTSSVATLTVGAAPSISSQPQSATNIAGTTANFSVTSTGVPAPGYQWQFNNTPISGATGSALSIPNVQTGNGGNYTVVVTNSVGSITSSVATLTVWLPPSVSSQPQSLTNVVGTPANFSVAATGIPLVAYQWQLNNLPISGATGSAFSLLSVQPGDAGNYSVIITNSAGAVTSSVVSLTVWVPPSIVGQPQSITNVVNTAANFSVAASGIPSPGYQWQFNGSPIGGATGSAFSIPSVQTTNGGAYAVVISNSAGAITSAVASLTVWVPVSISSQPQSLTNVTGTTANFAVTAFGVPSPAYQWQFNSSPIAGATGSAFSIPNVQTSNGGNYSVVITNSVNAITSSVAALTVWVPVSISSQPQSLTNVVGTTANFSVSASGVPSPAYQWQFNNSPIAGATSSAFSIPNVQIAGAGNYSVVITNPASAITSSVAVLTVWVPVSISSQPQSVTNVVGTTANFSVSASGAPSPAYQWQFNNSPIAGATGSALSVPNVQITSGGNYSVVITNSASAITSSVATLTVWVPVSISSQPQSLTNIVGTTANFAVTASGVPSPAYQWQFNNSPIAGATSSALSIPNVQITGGGNYSVVITNSANAITTSVATLTVWVPISLSSQPQSLTNIVGTTANFSVSASGVPSPAYQWQFNNSPIPGATGPALSIPNIQISNGGNYSVAVTNSASAITSSVATLTVWVPASISAQPQSLTNIAGTTANFSVTAAGVPAPSYQWQFNGSPIAGATGSAMSVANVQTANGGGYSVVVTNVAGAITSSIATLTVWVPVSISSQPQGLTNIASTTANFSVTASGVPSPAYQWQFNNSPIAGATSSTLSIPNLQTINGGNYSVIITNSANAITSSVATLTVWIPISISSQPQSLTNIVGTTANFSVAASGIPPPAYQWQFNNSSIEGATASSLSIPNVQTTSGGNYGVVITNLAGGISSSVATLTVWVPVSISGQPQSLTNIVGTAANFSVAASGVPGPAYQWQLNNTPIPGATGSALSIPSVQTNDAGNYAVVVTNSANAITSSIATLTVWVPPSITSQPQNQTVYVGTNVGFSVSAAGTAPLNYQWQVNGTNLAGGTAGAVTFASVQVSNAGTYTVVITNVGGALTSAPALLTVVQPDTVIFCDIDLEDTVRAQLGKATGSVNRLEIRTLTSLRAVNSHITCLGGLEWATNLTQLQLGGNLVSDLSVLTNLTQLTNLSLYHNNATNVAALAMLPGLQSLDLRWNPGVRDFSPLVGLTNLSSLYLAGNAISNAAALPAVQGLALLDLNNNSISNAGALSVFTNVMTLDVSYNSSLNLQTLSTLTNLKSLHVSGGSMTNLAFVQSFAHLTNLCVAGNPSGTSLGDISAVLSLGELRALNLSANPTVTNFSALSSMINLETLWLKDDHLPNLSFVQPLSHLSCLVADENTVANVLPVSTLTNLTILSLENNLLGDATALSGLSSLTVLGLGANLLTNAALPPQLMSLTIYSNRLGALDSLSGLSNLGSLNAGANPFTDVSALAVLANLSSLSLFADGISNAALVPPLPRLATLDLSANRISDASALQSLPNLVSLNLSSNLITDASALGTLPNLTSLDVSSNNIADWSFLNNLPNLSTLSAKACSLSDVSFVTPLFALSSLDATLNRITNVTSVTTLTNLHFVLAGYNRSRDLSPLTALPRLWHADFRTNLVDLTDPAQITVTQTLSNRLVNLDVQPQNARPVINIATTWPVPVSGSSTLLFTVQDDVTPDAQLSITAVSSNPGLLSTNNILFASTTTNHSVQFTPTPGQSGSSQVTITVTDDTGLSTNATVLVTVVTQQTVVVPDANLSQLIRTNLNKPTGALNNVDMLKLTSLSAASTSISNLSGLEFATNLSSLSLETTLVKSLTPIQGLIRLSYLTVSSSPVADFSPIGALTNLNTLWLRSDSITNVSFLTNLRALITLVLSQNSIYDISPLATATSLSTLMLDQNLITNITVLTLLPALSYVDVTYNSLDIGNGSPVLTVISTLQSRGATVVYQPQRVPPAITAPAQWLITPGAPATLGLRVIDSIPASASYGVTAIAVNSNLLPNLTVTNQPSIGWTLTATATNQAGATTVTLQVKDSAGLTGTTILPVTVTGQSFGQLLNNAGYSFSSWGSAVWFLETTNTHSGGTAAQSGHISDNTNSWLGTTLLGPGRLIYWSKVSSETNFDFLDFFLNGVMQTNRMSGTNGIWQRFVFNIPQGTNSVAWRYQKDQDTSRGLDAGWVDDMNYAPGFWLEIISSSASGPSQFLLHGVPGNTYNLESSTNFLNWSQVQQTNVSDTATLVVDPSPAVGTRFYRISQ